MKSTRIEAQKGGYLVTNSAVDTRPATAVGTRRRSQSRAGSLTEAGTQVVVGFLLAFVVQGLIYPLFGIVTTPETNAAIAGIFTALSLVRSYLVRRAFETFGAF